MKAGRIRLALLPLLLLGLAGLQLLQPPAPVAVLPGDGPMTDHVGVSPGVAALLEKACYDCHSAETRWPWYSRISPLSWLIANDVQHGRSNLDFSSWSVDPEVEPTPDQRLRWICRDLRRGTMPPRLYRLAHPEARLTQFEEDEICAWADRARKTLEPAPVQTSAPLHPSHLPEATTRLRRTGSASSAP